MASESQPSVDSDSAREKSRSTLSRRRFIASTGVASAVALAGCGGGGGDGGDGGDGGGGSTGSGTNQAASELSVAAVEGSGRLFKRLMDEYVSDDTGIDVSVQLFPYANLFEKTSSILSAQSDAYDIMFMDDPWFPQFAANMDPLLDWLPGELPSDALIDQVEEIAKWPTPGAPKVPSAEGKESTVKGQVIVGNTQLYAYNKGYYDQVGADAPETWDDVLSAGKKITEQVDGANGYIIRGKRGNPAMANFFSLGNAIGGEMFNKDWRYNWASESGTAAVEFWARQLREISPDGVTSFNSDAVLNGLGSGSAAQAPAWPSAASLLLDPEQSKEANNLEFIPIPKGHTGAKRQAPTQGNWIMGINSFVSDSKKKAAGEVIQSSISAEAQSKYVELGGVPFRHDTFENHMDAQSWFPALYESLQNAQWRPRTPLYSEFGVSHGQLLNSCLAGDLSPSEMTSKAQNQIESTLSNAGYYE
ncbi:extracellular solute-binding protein [Haloarcula nitratireducens]|uniref:Extracellular solute-binding protein n=1 Tax=Haloarcula nitratireducens TaxID=2487749 RepID=A0AAW4PF54_9EURY|nr:extracellular solute-binding protein [Halomicroarcula nitratireducens]MBX0296170.1 extracellular solute-binding protein [Halomicroarcula nitratireducens]